MRRVRTGEEREGEQKQREEEKLTNNRCAGVKVTCNSL